MSSKWTPGQRLNSAAEVMQALLDGQKVRRDAWWSPQAYVHIVDGNLVTADGEQGNAYILHADDAHIYTPSKRTREVTVWVNVYADRAFCCNSKTEAENYANFGTALAVAVPATVTIEY